MHACPHTLPRTHICIGELSLLASLLTRYMCGCFTFACTLKPRRYFEDQAYYFPVVWWQDSPPAFMLEASEPQEQQEEQAQGEPTNGACEQ
eukprot:m.78772 g.78772  ORF g.78772 m.78772 type:complete len:91 (+) comp12543_c0_seq8:1258-1530(+)